MEATLFNFDRYQKPQTKATSERASLIELFVTRLNTDREASGYKPYSAKYVAMCMSHIKTDDLDFHYKQLSNSKNFCALWHWYNKPKK